MDDRMLLDQIRGIVGEKETEDDCSVIPLGDQYLVATTDMLHETTDFPGGMTDFEIGWMSAAVTLSDIASMAAVPADLLMAVGLDRPERLVGITRGAAACCSSVGARLAGGDIDSHTELTIVSTAFGFVQKDRILRRSGARPGDLVCVTGTPGQAEAGLKGDPRFWKSLITPVPRVREGIAFSEGGATAMMDLSDGLALSLSDLGRASEVGFSLDPALFPLISDMPDAEALFLFGGGDFELLVTVPPDRFPIAGVDATVIGVVTLEPEIRSGGCPIPLRGYAHRWE
ncbi:MAG: thiamine-phosphate kinase [Methanocalculus sp.]|uniref:thiamine-phosphate kinase n=1 Tax=Methanocalculus sp. TaxID=2004547 RepID=UPI00271BFF2B|nr:thiamine-phosphate kinase [Methanocalculus sp.]MDO9539219.1 thiamine-phosphate kinase [Methanocalculus sp.]